MSLSSFAAPRGGKPSRQVYRQGSLDGLCGFYCIINGLTLMRDGRFDGGQAFRDMIEIVGPSAFARYSTEGMTGRQLVTMVKGFSERLYRREGYHLHMRKAFRAAPRSLAEYWRVLDRHQATHGQGSIILATAGIHDHWSCVRRVTDKALLMADSGILRRIERHTATISFANPARPCILLPAHTYLLSITERD